MIRILSTAIVFQFLAGSALAVNVGFLPGDAFFATHLTKEQVEKLAQAPTKAHEFHYSPHYEGAFCGYAGYWRATLGAENEKLVKNIVLAYEELRDSDHREWMEIEQDGKVELYESDSPTLLFYREDAKGMHLGLRYNENWVKEVALFGHPRQHSRLCNFIKEADAVMYSWRDAEAFAPLGAKCPKFDGKSGPQFDKPILLPSKLKAVLIPHGELETCFRQDDHASKYEIDSKQIRVFHLDQSGGLGGYRWTQEDDEDDDEQVPF